MAPEAKYAAESQTQVLYYDTATFYMDESKDKKKKPCSKTAQADWLDGQMD